MTVALTTGLRWILTSFEQGSDDIVHAEWVRGHLRVLMNEGLFA